MSEKAPKNVRLCCWFLVHRIPIEKTLDRDDEIAATLHCRLSLSLWDQSKALFPKTFAGIEDKRQRRLAFYNTHGYCPNGITPGLCYPIVVPHNKKSIKYGVLTLVRIHGSLRVRESLKKK